VAEAGAPDIEITREMLLAGLSALPYLPSEMLDNCLAETMVSEVYRAMLECDPRVVFLAQSESEAHGDTSGKRMIAMPPKPHSEMKMGKNPSRQQSLPRGDIPSFDLRASRASFPKRPALC
jgi:hypothetical protein